MTHPDFSGRYSEIPPHMQDAIRRYVCDGREVGNFLRAVICNDLIGAFGNADSVNLPLIGLYVSWFYDRCPADLVGKCNYIAHTATPKLG